MTMVHGRCGILCAFILVGALAIMGCSSAPKSEAMTAQFRQILQERVDEKLTAADEALAQNKPDQALVLLEDAARMDPASKQPWLKRAQIRFDARQYGEAITYAHEVLQRDVNDLTAQSILAVSGLRVSAQALDELRKANEVSGSARSEAETVARLIKEVLGEPILVPVAEAIPRAPRRLLRSHRAAEEPSSPASSVSASTAPSSRSAAPAVLRTAPAASRSGNPFGALQ